MAFFNDRDRALIEALEYDPGATPSYEMIKGCLVWPDERADNLTREGYDRLCDLWIARSYIHRGRPLSSYPLSPGRMERVWSDALADGFRWPGFHRLELSPEDRAYYERCMREDAEDSAL